MKQQTSSPRTALNRYVEALARRGILIELEGRRGTSDKAIVLRREGKRRRVEFVPHDSRRNCELLEGVALCSKAIGGAGMTRFDLVKEVGFDDLGIVVPRLKRAKKKGGAA